MRIVLDPDFDAGCWPGPLRGADASVGEEWAGPGRLVQIFETALGLGVPPLSASDRAAGLVPAVRATDGFWSASARVDPFGTARRLLEWRDTLKMAGWRGGGREPRLAALATLTAGAAPGLPDRLLAILDHLERSDAGIESVELFTPRADFEPLWQRALSAIEQRGTHVVHTDLAVAAATVASDVARARGEKFVPQGDGSLLLLRPGGQLAAAEEVAAWLASLPTTSDVLLVGSDAVLDAALHRHGLPTTGAPNGSSDATPLQILPLVLDLGWQPQDPQRAYELLSLSPSPVPAELRYRLRDALERWPAVDSDDWRSAMGEGLAAIEDPARRARVRDRMDVIWNSPVQRNSEYRDTEIACRVEMLRVWLTGRIAVVPAEAPDWGAALRQCDGLLDQVRLSGLASLTAAQLRRLVVESTRGARSAAPFAAQAGVHVVGKPGGVAGATSRVVWWRFDEASAPRVMRLPLTRAERAELEAQGVRLPDPGHVAAAHARRWRRPLEQAMGSLLLVCPQNDAAGGALFPHPLWDELVSRVPEKNTRRAAEHALLRTTLAGNVPQRARDLLPLPAPKREWAIAPGRISRRETESPSSVETLLGCPFQWALRYVGKLYGPDSARVEDGTSPRLLGEFLHAVMNRLFAGPLLSPEDAEREAGAIFDREGPRLAAALFLPGNDSQRGRVRLVAMRTARSLYRLMHADHLQVRATEQQRAGKAFGTAFEGRVDLVLGDPPRILDLKWGGAMRRADALASGTALQLAAYSFLEGQGDGTFPPVAYFIMEQQRLLTAAEGSFDGAEIISGLPPEKTWELLISTHATEWGRLQEGQLPARGVEVAEGPGPVKQACVDGGEILVPPGCRYCDFGGLCGREFVEGA